VLFVSHNITAVRSLCNSAILLERGRFVAKGPVADILAQYVKPPTQDDIAYQRQEPVGDKPVLLRANLRTSSTTALHETAQPLALDLTLHHGRNPNIVVGLHLYDSQLNQVIHSSSQFAPGAYANGPQTTELRIVIPARALNVGRYRCTLVIAEPHRAIYENLEFILGFTIADSTFPGPGAPGDWSGACSPLLVEWSWQP